MVIGVVDQTVVGEDDALGAPAFGTQGVDVALGPFPALGIGQKSLVIAEFIAADAHAGGESLQATAFPAQGPGFFLGHEVIGQTAVGVDIQGNVFFRCVDAA